MVHSSLAFHIVVSINLFLKFDQVRCARPDWELPLAQFTAHQWSIKPIVGCLPTALDMPEE